VQAPSVREAAMKDQPFKKTRFTFIKYWWYELLEFISPDKTPGWSEEFKRRYRIYMRGNKRL